MSLGMAILPWGVVENMHALPAGQPEPSFCIEPLQVCEPGDSFLGVLFDFPMLLPGAPCFFASTEALPRVQTAAAFVPDGFPPAIDHPPQLSA